MQANDNRPPYSDSLAPGTGWRVVAAGVVYMLILYQLPLVPLLAHVLHPSEVHARCTDGLCYCKPGCRHHETGVHAQDHHSVHTAAQDHHSRHAAIQDHAEQPSRKHTTRPAFSTCAPPGATAPFMMPSLDKAFVTSRLLAAPQALPPLTYTEGADARPSSFLSDIFRPPRLL